MTKLISIPLLSFLLIFTCSSAVAQSLSWATQLKGSGSKDIWAGATDQAGNIYSVGRFLGVVDFDPGPSSFNLDAGGSFSNDIFVVKQSPDGTLIWAIQFGSDYACTGTAITIGPLGDLYIAGRFSYTVDFDPGPGIANLTAQSADDVFVLRLTSRGKFVWVKQITGDVSTDYVDDPHLISDATGNVLLNVNYGGSFDFDPGSDAYNLTTSGATLDQSDIALCKLSPSGDFIWAKRFASLSTERVHSIKMDNEGNILLAGYIGGQVDFDGGPGVYNVGMPDNLVSFIGKFSADGQPVWVKTLDDIVATCIDKDRFNNYYVGSYSAVPFPRARLSKFSSEGTELWNKVIENVSCCSGYVTPKGLTTDRDDHVYVVFEYLGTFDFDPSPAVYPISSVSNYDVALAHYNENGGFVWVNHFGGIREDKPTFLLIDSTGNLITGGKFSNTVDFDPGLAVYNLTAQADPVGDLFIAKFSKSNHITGKIFQDDNADGIKQFSEPYLSNVTVKGTRGQRSYFAITDSLGLYKMITDTGSYIVNPTLPQYYSSILPSKHTIDFGSATGVSDTGNHFAMTPAVVSAIRITITPTGPARPGFLTNYRITYTNTGTDTASGTVTVVHDSQLSLDASSPVPKTIADPILKWDFFNLPPSMAKNIDVWFKVSSQASLGTVLKSYTEADPLTGEFEPVNISDTAFQIVSGSYDPNDKKVSPSDAITPDFISSGRYLDYTIRFQNTGTDTAFSVKIIDTLSSNVDIESLQMLSASHAYTAKLNGDGIVQWQFDNILLPDSGRNEPASQGFIRYRIKAKNGIGVGNQIKNRAAIYFDYNFPVNTNETVNTVTVITAVSSGVAVIDSKIFPNPTNSSLFLKVKGYFHYTIYDISGKIIFVSEKKYNEGVITTSALARGMYFIEVKTLNGRAVHKVLVN